ncbi:PPE family protein [Mycobacterium kansasii]|uniref:PPE family protein n=1 Tax=Mycobacterium kansasii TaxID=1768 RepID=A0A1V3WHC5_MYCKA|nr:PPE family protein [Mycobacterium kansasii]
MMNFSVLPPEINSARMFVGAGPGPMLSAAAAWDGLAAELQAAATSFSSVTSELAAPPGRGRRRRRWQPRPHPTWGG